MAKNLKTLTIDNTSYTFRPYGTCTVAASTAAKSVTCSDFLLVTGATILVKFTYANSANNATLNVNSTGAKTIWYNGAALSASRSWPAGSIVEFYYDGSYWQILSMQLPNASESTYGIISTSGQTFAGDKTFRGNLIIQNATATEGSGASPSLIFRKGTDSDNAFDWDIFNNSASKLFIRTQYDNSGTKTWYNAAILEKGKSTFAGNVTADSFTGVKDDDVDWGGKNRSGVVGPIDAALIQQIGTNRLAFLADTAITIEYSTESGSTWSTYSTTSANKINTFNGNLAWHRIGSSTAYNANLAKYMLRYTIRTDNTTNVYANINKFAIYCSVDGSTGSYCTIEARTETNRENGTNTWAKLANKVSIDGWAGWNIINTSQITTYGHSGSKSSQYSEIRFTFGITSHTNTANAGLRVGRILAYGGVGWTFPSNLASTGDIYTYDYQQNVTFPAKVTATKFVGTVNLSGSYSNGVLTITAGGE